MVELVIDSQHDGIAVQRQGAHLVEAAHEVDLLGVDLVPVLGTVQGDHGRYRVDGEAKAGLIGEIPLEVGYGGREVNETLR